jgi:hypothetical protein
MGIVVVMALVSDRLCCRNEIAAALGPPVSPSVSTLRRRRRLPWRAAKLNWDMRLLVAHLQGAVPGSSRGPASLAVVALDDARVVARAVAFLARSCAGKGKQVVVAGLSSSVHLAHFLAVTDFGVHAVSQNGAQLVVALPDRAEVASVGLLHGGISPVAPAQATEAVVAACAAADLLLTLATLDPAFGGDHLATWATDVVAAVTAGRSSAERVRGVGEMIRLAGSRVDSVMLVSADKSDESLGATPTPDEPAPVQASLGVSCSVSSPAVPSPAGA